MLYNLNRKIIHKIPHGTDYNRWRDRLSNDNYHAIMNKLEEILNSDNVLVSSYIPGNDWTGTVFDPIYNEACNRNIRHSALFFGLLMWEAVMKHPDNWSFIKSGNVQGLTYFRIEL